MLEVCAASHDNRGVETTLSGFEFNADGKPIRKRKKQKLREVYEAELAERGGPTVFGAPLPEACLTSSARPNT